MTASKLESLLSPCKDGELSALVKRARELESLSHVLNAALPADQRCAIVAANVRKNGELVVVCSSSAWAARMRYETESLTAAASQAGFEVTSCRVRVARG